MNNYRYLLWTTIAFSLMIASCSNKKKGENTSAASDSYSEGKSEIWVEEGFKPIINEQLDVFLAVNPKADLKVNYESEHQIIEDLLAKGSRTVVISRDLTENEKKVLKTKGFTPEIAKIANDAVALIVNSAVSDTSITVGRLKKLLKGDERDKNLVFENPNSGTVRFLREFSGSALNSPNIFALKSNKEVIQYISENKLAIGIVSFDWLGSDEVKNIIEKVRVVSVCDEKGGCYKPSQTSLALKQYPLSRAIYVINASGRLGLGAGFTTFLAGERGQRIMLKSELLPAEIPGREIRITE